MAVLVHDAVDQAAAHDRLADGGLGAPVGTIREQIIERDGEVVVGVHQPRRRRHDPVPIGVRIGGERDAKAILEADEAGHRVRVRGVHADLAVVIDGHEGELRIDRGIDDGDVEAVAPSMP